MDGNEMSKEEVLAQKQALTDELKKLEEKKEKVISDINNLVSRYVDFISPYKKGDTISFEARVVGYFSGGRYYNCPNYIIKDIYADDDELGNIILVAARNATPLADEFLIRYNIETGYALESTRRAYFEYPQKIQVNIINAENDD